MTRDRWTAEEYRHYLETGKEPPQLNLRLLTEESPECEAERKRSKFSNRKTDDDGITFDSLHEHNVYLWLKSRRNAGELRWIFVHIPFRFTSGVVYWADFMTVRADGRIEAVWDAKSDITARNSDYVIKKKTLKAEWGVEICEVFASDADGCGGYYNPSWPIMGAADEGNVF